MRKLVYILLASVGLLAGCNEYNKVLKSTDYEYKYQKANEYFEKKDYFRAVALYEEVLPVFRPTIKGEPTFYRYCYSHYYLRDYYLAGYYFKSFARFYPSSEKAEECLFMSALCNVKLSPVYYLDQTDTKNAISDLQSFVNRFPESTRRDTCNKLMDQLRYKLDKKDFENARLYLKTENFKAAVVSFTAILESNPGTPFKEEIMALRVEAAYRYALNSIPAKKAERLQQASNFYTKFVAAYPNSSWIDEAEVFGVKAQRELEDIK